MPSPDQRSINATTTLIIMDSSLRTDADRSHALIALPAERYVEVAMRAYRDNPRDNALTSMCDERAVRDGSFNTLQRVTLQRDVDNVLSMIRRLSTSAQIVVSAHMRNLHPLEGVAGGAVLERVSSGSGRWDSIHPNHTRGEILDLRARLYPMSPGIHTRY